MQKTHVLNLDFIHLFIISFLAQLCQTSMLMISPYLSQIGGSRTYIGFFMNITSLTLVIFVFFFTHLSNRIDRKRFMLYSLGLFIISASVMFFFPASLTCLLIMKFFSSISYALCYTMLMNLAYEELPEAKRASGIALFGMSGIMSIPTGAFLGEITLKHFPPPYLFILAGIISILTVITLIFLKEPAAKANGNECRTFLDVIKDKKIFILLYPSAIFGGAYGIMTSFIPTWSLKMTGTARLTDFVSAFAMVSIFVRIFLGKTLDHYKQSRLIVSAMSCLMVSAVMVCFIHTRNILFFSGLIYGLGHSVLFPVLSSRFVNSACGDENRAVYNDVFVGINTFGCIFFSTILGLTGDFLGTRFIFISLAALLFAGIIYYVIHRRSEEKIL